MIHSRFLSSSSDIFCRRSFICLNRNSKRTSREKYFTTDQKTFPILNTVTGILFKPNWLLRNTNIVRPLAHSRNIGSIHLSLCRKNNSYLPRHGNRYATNNLSLTDSENVNIIVARFEHDSTFDETRNLSTKKLPGDDRPASSENKAQQSTHPWWGVKKNTEKSQNIASKPQWGVNLQRFETNQQINSNPLPKPNIQVNEQNIQQSNAEHLSIDKPTKVDFISKPIEENKVTEISTNTQKSSKLFGIFDVEQSILNTDEANEKAELANPLLIKTSEELRQALKNSPMSFVTKSDERQDEFTELTLAMGGGEQLIWREMVKRSSRPEYTMTETSLKENEKEFYPITIQPEAPETHPIDIRAVKSMDERAKEAERLTAEKREDS